MYTINKYNYANKNYYAKDFCDGTVKETVGGPFIAGTILEVAVLNTNCLYGLIIISEKIPLAAGAHAMIDMK